MDSQERDNRDGENYECVGRHYDARGGGAEWRKNVDSLLSLDNQSCKICAKTYFNLKRKELLNL